MSKPLCKGDRASHAGVAKTVPVRFMLDGRGVALVEDIVRRPQ